jgi:hypothetical protein
VKVPLTCKELVTVTPPEPLLSVPPVMLADCGDAPVPILSRPAPLLNVPDEMLNVPPTIVGAPPPVEAAADPDPKVRLPPMLVPPDVEPL